MIEFTPDGPFSEKANQLFPGRVRVLGLGQTGAAVCDQLVLHGRPQQDLWVFDSDQSCVEGSVVPNRRLLGRSLVHGLGCGGDVDLGREIVAIEETGLANVANACDFLILVLGLSGGTGVALAEHFIELGHEAGAKVIVVGVQPFAFEGIARRERAIQAIADLRAEADSVLVMASDRIADNPTTQRNIRHGFHLMHQQMAYTVQALSQVVCKRGLIQLSFADVRALYARYSGSEVLENSWVAHVEGDTHDRTEDLVAELLAAPMLVDESVWKRVDHAIVAVNGSRDIGLSEVQELVSLFKDRLPVNVPIATSASLDEDSSDNLSMTVLLATTAPARLSVPELAANFEKPPRRKRVKSDTAPLPPLPLQASSVAEDIAGEPPAEPLPKPAKKASRKPMPVAPPALAEPPPPAAPVEPLVPVAEEIEGAAEEEIARATAAEIEPEPELETESPPVALDEAEEPEPPPITVPMRSRRFEAKQEEMSFESPPRGRFEKTHETMYRGENLDQPTFRRRGLKIRT
jgi:cell division protein FtsZ